MEDFMDNLVKEVEGNVKPIRSVKMEDFDDVQPAGTASSQPKPMFRKVDWSIYKGPSNAETVIHQPVKESDPANGSAPVPVQNTASEGKNVADNKELYLHVHRENVKCYRNTQAVVVENSDRIRKELKESHSGINGWLVALLILSIVNLGANAYLILHMVFGII